MSTTATTRRRKIIDGPRAEIIWTAAQHAYSQEIKATITFTEEGGLPQSDGSVMKRIMQPQIIGASHEDASGQSLNIEGYLDGKHFTGYYNARSRTGYIDVEL